MWLKGQCEQQLDQVMECTRGRVELQQVFLTKKCSQSMQPVPVTPKNLKNCSDLIEKKAIEQHFIPDIRIIKITILPRTLATIFLIFVSFHETHKRMLISNGIYY